MPAGLVADVGGTNVRFASATADVAGAPVLSRDRRLSGDAYPDFESCLADYLGPERPRQAVLAVAGAVNGDEVRFTNRPWAFSIDSLKRRFGFERLEVFNDFAAIAHALRHLPAGAFRALPGPAWPTSLPERVSIIGPGTGLGVAMLCRVGVVPTEAGHSTFAPRDLEEIELARALLLEDCPRATWETLLSGPGIERLHRALAAVEGRKVEPLSAADIVRRAEIEGPARRTAERFALLLASACGDLALAQGAQAVALAGGVSTHMAPFLETERFRTRFGESGPPAAGLAHIPVARVIHPEPGLLGAAWRLVGAD